MPNHVHGIIRLGNVNFDKWLSPEDVETIREYEMVKNENRDVVETIHESSLPERKQMSSHCRELFQHKTNNRNMLLYKIIGRFKMQSAKHINKFQNTLGQPFWQTRFYDRIVRDNDQLESTRKYIQQNPEKWSRDRNAY
jgi:REP element-mobilizing transposase RayT